MKKSIFLLWNGISAINHFKIFDADIKFFVSNFKIVDIDIDCIYHKSSFYFDIEFKIRISGNLASWLNIDFKIEYDFYKVQILILIFKFYETIQECWFWYWINHVNFKNFKAEIEFVSNFKIVDIDIDCIWFNSSFWYLYWI